MKFFFYILLKIKLINTNNFIYIISQRFYNLSNLIFFKNISITNSPKFKSLPFHYEYFQKINKIVKNKYSKFEYKDNDVLEVGGGEFWGLMPFFAKEQASSYTNIDLIIDKRIINSNFIWNKFLKKNLDYVPLSKIKNLNFKTLNCKIEELSKNKKFDKVVSISCLEHVEDLNSFFLNIKKNTYPDTKHLHVVNFTSHLNKKYPFKHLYNNEKNFFIKNFKANINLLRISDYKKILDLNHFKYKIIILDSYSLNKDEVSSLWIQNYSLQELSVTNAILIIDGYDL